MAFKPVPISSLTAQHGIKCLVHGRAGFGKTSLIPTCPRPIVLSAESGLLSIAGSGLSAVVIRTEADLMDAYEWAVASGEARNYDTIALDSISEIAETILSTAKIKAKDPRQAYGEMQERIAATTRRFRDLPNKHIYFSAKTELRKTPEGGLLWQPMVPGAKAAEATPYFYDEVFFLNIATHPDGKGTYRYLQTQPDLVAEAKDRSGVLDSIEEPHLGKIFAKIMSRMSAPQV